MTAALGIERHQKMLLRLAAVMIATVSLVSGGTAFLPRRVRIKVLRVLLPVESAARRLIVTVSTGVSISSRASGSGPTGTIPRGSGDRTQEFVLFDRKKRAGDKPQRRSPKHAPRISSFDEERVVEPEKPAPLPDDLVDAARLRRRLDALKRALEDPHKHARRLLRAQARRAKKAPGSMRVGPIRFGRAPGQKRRPKSGEREGIDEILAECHRRALLAIEASARASPKPA